MDGGEIRRGEGGTGKRGNYCWDAIYEKNKYGRKKNPEIKKKKRRKAVYYSLPRVATPLMTRRSWEDLCSTPEAEWILSRIWAGISPPQGMVLPRQWPRG